MENKKVFVSGCFDLLHSGHIKFLNIAAELGDVYVALGSDANVRRLKETTPTYNEKERKFILNNLKSVKKAFISPGFGKLHFIEDLETIKPDIFVVNEDGHSPEKQEICESRGIDYKVLKKIPEESLPARSSTEMRSKKSKLPYRIDIAGGWLDQPHVSKLHPGAVLTISIEPSQTFNFRSGMATSTRKSAIKLWGDEMPDGDPEALSKILFRYDNPPGTEEVAGSQDSLGIIMPALNYLYYDGQYWPEKIKTINDEETLSWLEDKIYLVPLAERAGDYEVYKNSQLNESNVKKLSEATESCFKAILEKNLDTFAKHFTESFNAQTELFPSTFPKWIQPIVEKYKKLGAKGWKLSGAGGGGYLILISDVPIEGAINIKVRRQ